MKKIVLIIGVFLLTNAVFSQEKILFHEYEPTASDFRIIQWNIADTTNVKWVLKEIVDNQGRVIELIFLENGKEKQRWLSYIATRVTFEYQDRKIIVRRYQADQPLLTNSELEIWYKSIHHLDEENFIVKREKFFIFDFSDMMDSVSIMETKKYISEHHSVVLPGLKINRWGNEFDIQLSVLYYTFSYAKMNGIFPISRNFEIERWCIEIANGKPAKISIINGIKKLKNSR